jgi:hypothetical protein
MPFLATRALTKSYGILAPEKLQDFYNISPAEKSTKNGKILARPRKIWDTAH